MHKESGGGHMRYCMRCLWMLSMRCLWMLSMLTKLYVDAWHGLSVDHAMHLHLCDQIDFFACY